MPSVLPRLAVAVLLAMALLLWGANAIATSPTVKLIPPVVSIRLDG